MSKSALITGISGMDGSLLADLLLERGYKVHGLIRRTALYPDSLRNLKHLEGKIELHFGDLENENHLAYLVHDLKPDEIYHMASQSDVRVSFDIPEYTGDVTGLGTTRLLEAVRYFSPGSKVYNAASSEMFGDALAPQNESSPMHPRSPYGAAKLYSYHMCQIYRESYKLFISNGICFNHEHPRRGRNFVTQKIALAVNEIKRGERKELFLGNLEAMRDWGWAPDYVEAMWRMLQQDKPDDFVVGTGRAYSVRAFMEEAFRCVGLSWEEYVKIDPSLFRPVEVPVLLADASKARRILGWKPSVAFYALVRLIVKADGSPVS